MCKEKYFRLVVRIEILGNEHFGATSRTSTT
jgi:hypothetical protein